MALTPLSDQNNVGRALNSFHSSTSSTLLVFLGYLATTLGVLSSFYCLEGIHPQDKCKKSAPMTVDVGQMLPISSEVTL